jgi:hypothetical protein
LEEASPTTMACFKLEVAWTLCKVTISGGPSMPFTEHDMFLQQWKKHPNTTMARGINMSRGACPLPEPILSKRLPSMGPYFSNDLIGHNIKIETQIHIQHNSCINRSIIF